MSGLIKDSCLLTSPSTLWQMFFEITKLCEKMGPILSRRLKRHAFISKGNKINYLFSKGILNVTMELLLLEAWGTEKYDY